MWKLMFVFVASWALFETVIAGSTKCIPADMVDNIVTSF